VLNYNGADFTHFAGYVRCRIHYALYDAMRKIWKEEENTAPLPAGDDADLPALADNIIEREELAILLKLALKKLTEKQRNTIKALYFDGYSGKEIATKLKITPAMVFKHHKQALKNLRSNIA
jgi:RNA polymerase sigma factor (sigma-70 family)